MHKVNKKPMNEFDAEIVSFNYQSMQLSIEYQTGLIKPTLIKHEVKPKLYELVIDFMNQLDISRFMAEVLRGFELNIDDGYVYDCFLKDANTRQDGICSYTLTLSVLVIQKGQKRKRKLIGASNIVNIDGTYQSPIIYEIIPRYDGNISVGGYTIRNIHDGKKIVIDGENCLITEDGKNKYSDTLFTKFPVLVPGMHTIEVSNTNADIWMIYSPIYM